MNLFMEVCHLYCCSSKGNRRGWKSPTEGVGSLGCVILQQCCTGSFLAQLEPVASKQLPSRIHERRNRRKYEAGRLSFNSCWFRLFWGAAISAVCARHHHNQTKNDRIATNERSAAPVRQREDDGVFVMVACRTAD
ncbi:hypothetical protein BSKO_08773 [Bryopsis sp. KO-2023]|nr:hypothetical protein BSKO_08773 [Bryopsis sp. KO-2023]